MNKGRTLTSPLLEGCAKMSTVYPELEVEK